MNIQAENKVRIDKKAVTASDDGDKRGLDVKILGAIEGAFAPSGLKNGGVVTEVQISSNEWTALPHNAYELRNAMSIQNQTGEEIKINYDPTITGYVGVVLVDKGERYYDITSDITVYAKAKPGSSGLVIVEELG